MEKREYVIQSKSANGNLKIIDIVTEEISFLSERELVQFFLSGELEFVTDSALVKQKTY